MLHVEDEQYLKFASQGPSGLRLPLETETESFK